MKVPFYVLGLLIRWGPQHGYKLMQMMEEGISDFAKIKLPTIYYHLQKLDEQGYITKTIDKDGNRPEKFIYTITDKGIDYYHVLFTRLLNEEYSPEFALDGVLFYSDREDKNVLLDTLKRKRDQISIKIDELNHHKESSMVNIPDKGKSCAVLIFEHHICHLEAEFSWLDKVIKGLEC